MLWACLHFPLLALESIARGNPQPGPLAIVAGTTRPRIVALDARAQHAGLRPGMALAGALALVPDLTVHVRNPAREAQALREIAHWALQFSPLLSLEGEEALLLEVGAGLKLFGGLQALRATMQAELAALGFSATLTAAPTPSAALLLARGRCPQMLTDARALRTQLSALAVEATGCSDETMQTLADLGIHTLGALLELPRDGFVRRFGQSLRDMLDRALGLQPDPRLPFALPEQFEARIELPAPARETEALLFALKRLLTALSGWLRGRGLGVMRLRLQFVHETCAPSALILNLSTPGRDPAHLAGLLRERLERFRLPERVEAIALATEANDRCTARDRSLFPGMETAEESELLERLCARLGDEAVCALRPCADHRPEHAWRAETPAPSPPAPRPPAARPLWLLPEPQPLTAFLHGAQSPVVLLDGPERIESGWWEGRDVRRDYFVARVQDGQTLWIFNPPDGGQWYVHGIFA
jgi:protein ImuB